MKCKYANNAAKRQSRTGYLVYGRKVFVSSLWNLPSHFLVPFDPPTFTVLEVLVLDFDFRGFHLPRLSYQHALQGLLLALVMARPSYMHSPTCWSIFHSYLRGCVLDAVWNDLPWRTSWRDYTLQICAYPVNGRCVPPNLALLLILLAGRWY